MKAAHTHRHPEKTKRRRGTNTQAAHQNKNTAEAA
jgi:hypothetical protein